MTLLIVDDDDLIVRGALRLVGALGHRGHRAHTLAEARELLKNVDVDVVIADLALAGRETGLDLLRWLREHRPRVRRVLTSGATQPIRTADSPEQEFLNKPFGRDELSSLLGAA